MTRWNQSIAWGSDLFPSSITWPIHLTSFFLNRRFSLLYDRKFFFSETKSHAYLEWDSTNSYHPNQLNQEKREKSHVKINSKIWPAFIYEERTITITIFVPVFWNKASSPVPTSFFSPTLNWTTFFSSFLLYRAFLAKERNLMHRNILLRVSYLLQRAATHLLRTHFQRHIFHDRERYNQITSLERNKSSRCYVSARGD